MTMIYLIIAGDEDGNPINILRSKPEDVAELMEDYSITKWEDESFMIDNNDPAYWPDGVAVLVRCEVAVPRKKETVTSWEV